MGLNLKIDQDMIWQILINAIWEFNKLKIRLYAFMNSLEFIMLTITFVIDPTNRPMMIIFMTMSSFYLFIEIRQMIDWKKIKNLKEKNRPKI